MVVALEQAAAEQAAAMTAVAVSAMAAVAAAVAIAAAVTVTGLRFALRSDQQGDGSERRDGQAAANQGRSHYRQSPRQDSDSATAPPWNDAVQNAQRAKTGRL